MADLLLRQNNPYSIGSVFEFDSEDGELALDRKTLTYTKGVNDKYHTLIQGETLWMLADRYYGDSKYYWIIADVNDIELALDIEVGTILVIPDFNQLTLSPNE